MEANLVKRGKTRKRKRHAKLKRREQAKLEVRFAKRRKLVSERIVPVHAKPRDLLSSTMQAETFWQNYEAAHDWQRRHNIVWWQSRCAALEQENAVLRQTIANLTGVSKTPVDRTPLDSHNHHNWQEEQNPGTFEVDHEEEHSDDENFEFQVNEDMMKFFEHSIRHKLQLQKDKKNQLDTDIARVEEETVIEGGAAWMQARVNGAKLLYGDSSARILAMETALQATMDRHKDRAKPQFWPNIPLNLQASESDEIIFS